jgi:hypothetical protein
LREDRVKFFWDESNESLIEFSWLCGISIEGRDQMMDILFGPIPGGFIKGSIETIRTRSGIASHIFDNCVQLSEIRSGVCKVGEVWIR